MLVPLRAVWINHLCQLSESGMGYQCVYIKLKNGEIIKRIVVNNAELLEWPPERSPLDLDDVLDVSLSCQSCGTDS